MTSWSWSRRTNVTGSIQSLSSHQSRFIPPRLILSTINAINGQRHFRWVGHPLSAQKLPLAYNKRCFIIFVIGSHQRIEFFSRNCTLKAWSMAWRLVIILQFLFSIHTVIKNVLKQSSPDGPKGGQTFLSDINGDPRRYHLHNFTAKINLALTVRVLLWKYAFSNIQ